MLEVAGLSRHFGGVRAVSDLSFTVSQGQFLGVIGPNGAGKTTLLNLVTGYLRPSAGTIRFENQPIQGLPPYRICKRGIGRTFQVVRPFGEMSVEDNVMVGALFAPGERVSMAQAAANVERPLELTGLLHKRHRPASELSIGEKKKLELARALAVGAKLLLLDEVMGGLTRPEVGDLIATLRRIHASGVTILMIEHIVEAILALSQRVLVLNFGQKLFEGTPREVMEHPAVIESYLGRPLDKSLNISPAE
jgi:branched-chain amino acid transport system ATP-binding protein